MDEEGKGGEIRMRRGGEGKGDTDEEGGGEIRMRREGKGGEIWMRRGGEGRGDTDEEGRGREIEEIRGEERRWEGRGGEGLHTTFSTVPVK